MWPVRHTIVFSRNKLLFYEIMRIARRFGVGFESGLSPLQKLWTSFSILLDGERYPLDTFQVGGGKRYSFIGVQHTRTHASRDGIGVRWFVMNQYRVCKCYNNSQREKSLDDLWVTRSKIDYGWVTVLVAQQSSLMGRIDGLLALSMLADDSESLEKMKVECRV